MVVYFTKEEHIMFLFLYIFSLFFTNEIVSIGPESIFNDNKGNSFFLLQGTDYKKDLHNPVNCTFAKEPTLLATDVKEAVSYNSGVYFLKNGVSNNIYRVGVVPVLNNSNPAVTPVLTPIGALLNGGITTPSLTRDERFKFFNNLIVYNFPNATFVSHVEKAFLGTSEINNGNFINGAVSFVQPGFINTPGSKVYYTPSFGIALNGSDNLLYYHGVDPFDLNSTSSSVFTKIPYMSTTQIKDILFVQDYPDRLLVFQEMNGKYKYVYWFSPITYLKNTNDFLSIQESTFKDLRNQVMIGTFDIPSNSVEKFFSNGISFCYTEATTKELYCNPYYADYSQEGFWAPKKFIKVGIKNVKKVEFFNSTTKFILTEGQELYVFGFNPFVPTTFEKLELEKPKLLFKNIKDIIVSKREYAFGPSVFFIDNLNRLYSIENCNYMFSSNSKYDIYYNSTPPLRFLPVPNIDKDTKIYLHTFLGLPMLFARQINSFFPITYPYDTSNFFLSQNPYNFKYILQYYNINDYDFDPDGISTKIVLTTRYSKLSLTPGQVDSAATSFVKVRNKELIGAALTNTGKLAVYGTNNYGIKGYTGADRLRTIQIISDPAYKIIDFAISQSETLCYVLENNTVYCAGKGDYGQCGKGTTSLNNPIFLPVKKDVSTFLSDAVKIFAQKEGFCVLTTAKKAFCWGRNASTEFCASPGQKNYAVQAISDNVIDISENNFSERNFVFYLKENKEVYACGDNRNYRLGISSPASNNIQGKVNLNFLYEKIKENEKSLCYVRHGALQCYGEINKILQRTTGKLVSSRHSVSTVPTKHLVRVNDFAINNDSLCYTNDNKELYCIGDNPFGVGFGCNNRFCSSGVENANFYDITIGKNHACARTETGEIYCWGDNRLGQVGIPGYAKNGVPERVPDPPGKTEFYLSVDAGDNHVCAFEDRTGNNTLYCWGDNSKGQLGVPGIANSKKPIRVPLPPEIEKIQGISAGANHTCISATINVSGNLIMAIYCAGDNTFGQIGNRNASKNGSFEMVFSSLTPGNYIVALESTNTRTCFVTYNSGLSLYNTFCMGDNRDKLISNNNIQIIKTPTHVQKYVTSENIFIGSSLICEQSSSAFYGCFGNPTFNDLL
ncbi:MAG: hypothetical protein N3A54_03330 [Patescibacteria group bacterium]|nr:hypothetical protein [Patescibacteria group bacterium]